MHEFSRYSKIICFAFALVLALSAPSSADAWDAKVNTPEDPYRPPETPDEYNDVDGNGVANDTVCYMSGVIPDYTTGYTYKRKEKGVVHDGAFLSPNLKNCPEETNIDGGQLIKPSSDPESWYYKASRIRITNIPSNDPAIVDPNNFLTIDGRGYYDFTETLKAPEGEYKHITTYAGVRARKLSRTLREVSLTPIDAWNACRYVQNYSENDIFIPFRTREEWYSFINNAPAGVEITPCALWCKGHCENHGLMFGPTSKIPDLNDGGDPKIEETELPLAMVPNLAVIPNLGKTWVFPKVAAHDVDYPNISGDKYNTHTFNHTCYRYYSEPKCWEYETVQKCTPTPKGCEGSECTGEKCVSEEQCVAGRMGTVCKSQEYSWTEVWKLHVTADASTPDFAGIEDNEGRNNGWQDKEGKYPASVKIGGGTRPSECAQSEEDLNYQDGDECKSGVKPVTPCVGFSCGGFGGGGDDPPSPPADPCNI